MINPEIYSVHPQQPPSTNLLPCSQVSRQQSLRYQRPPAPKRGRIWVDMFRMLPYKQAWLSVFCACRCTSGPSRAPNPGKLIEATELRVFVRPCFKFSKPRADSTALTLGPYHVPALIPIHANTDCFSSPVTPSRQDSLSKKVSPPQHRHPTRESSAQRDQPQWPRRGA